MFKNLIPLIFSGVLLLGNACFAPQKYFADVPMESGETVKLELQDSVLLRLSIQILQLHDFKLTHPLRNESGDIVLMGEKISTQLLKQQPLSDGAVRIRIRPLGPEESQIWFTWHSFYRKNLKKRIQTDVQANTARFWTLLNTHMVNR